MSTAGEPVAQPVSRAFAPATPEQNAAARQRLVDYMREHYDIEFADVAPFSAVTAPGQYAMEVDILLTEIQKLYDWGGDERRKEITKQLMEMLVSYHWPGVGIKGMVERLGWLLVSEWLETGQWRWIEDMRGDLEKIKESVGRLAQGSDGQDGKPRETITLD